MITSVINEYTLKTPTKKVERYNNIVKIVRPMRANFFIFIIKKNPMKYIIDVK